MLMLGSRAARNVVPVCTYPVVKASLYLLPSPSRARLSSRGRVISVIILRHLDDSSSAPGIPGTTSYLNRSEFAFHHFRHALRTGGEGAFLLCTAGNRNDRR